MQIFREIGKALLLGVLIFILRGVIGYINGVQYGDAGDILIDFIHTQIYTVIIYMANAYFFQYLMSKYGTDFRKSRLLIRSLAGGMGVTLIGIFLARLIIIVFMGGESLISFLERERPQDYVGGMIISLVVTIVFFLFYYYRYTSEKKVKEQKIIAGTASAQFDALKNQLDPHFLFNSLNVLTSLIEENPQAATRFTTSLSKVYRYVLEQKNKELVTVEEELRFAKIYMSLIEMRFEDSIIFETPAQLSNPDAKVVPLSLQLLLENAVKHNQVTPSRRLHIRIYEKDNNLVIENNVQPKKVVKESSGVGLQNIRQRYYLLSDRPVRIQGDEKIFKVAIPMLTRQSKGATTQEVYLSSKKYERAKKQVEEVKGFYVHLTIYIIMVPVFIYLNYRSTGFPWAIFPIVGWGAGVVGHAMEVFKYNPLLGKNWEERQIRKYMNEED
ncbi:2TM domain-containing protein [Aureitalea marina]|uniref:Histidine kinase n=1 Tax=Aureitalea marina TaxID=930804 RepID=A0A2S7KPS9_9FLAO|nr:2TM domain-containing protein [Aureitalea marina]PQB04636.1 histidine kinase [Aureitalea marina]